MQRSFHLSIFESKIPRSRGITKFKIIFNRDIIFNIIELLLLKYLSFIYKTKIYIMYLHPNFLLNIFKNSLCLRIYVYVYKQNYITIYMITDILTLCIIYCRIFWIISFTIALIVAIYYSCYLYQKWSGAPVIISLSPDPISLNELPFPSVTICNMNKVKKSEARRIERG